MLSPLFYAEPRSAVLNPCAVSRAHSLRYLNSSPQLRHLFGSFTNKKKSEKHKTKKKPTIVATTAQVAMPPFSILGEPQRGHVL